MKKSITAETEQQARHSQDVMQNSLSLGVVQGFVDNRSETIALSQLKVDVNGSPQMTALRRQAESFHHKSAHGGAKKAG